MATAPINTVQQQGISPYASEYTTDILGRAKALSETPYTPYAGNRVAGFTDMQRGALGGIGSLAGYEPMDYSDPSKFMSPYQQNVTDIALREARRQSDITGQANAARAVQQGAFGGSRHGLVEAEQQRNLQQLMSDIQAKGLQSAFDSAQRSQYLQDLGNRFGYTTGVDALKNQFEYGEKERGLEQKGLDIDYENFERQRKYPYENLIFARDMLKGLPMTTTSTTGQVPGTDWASTLLGGAGLLAKNPDLLKNATGGIKDLFNWLSGSSGGGGGGGSFPEGVYGGGYTMPESSEIDDYLKNISEAEWPF